MSAFTFTAPTISEAEELAEREALSAEERQRLHEEVYGKEREWNATEDLVERSLQLLNEALENMPSHEKTEYVEALERAPGIVARESSPLSFLHCCDFDGRAAASKLVFYWKVRKSLFGYKACMPMTLAEAMSDDAVHLRKAFVYVLMDDEAGRPVLFEDRVKCVRDVVPRESLLRCHFYVLHTIAMSERAQRKGYVVLRNMKGYDIYRHFDRMLDKLLFATSNCMPVKAKAIHLYAANAGTSVFQLVLPILKHMAGRDYRLRLHVHSGSSTQLFRQLEEFGLGSGHVTAFLGGCLTNSTSSETWIDQQRVHEGDMTYIRRRAMFATR